MKKVFLDAGHGGKDPGAIGNGLNEKDIALSVTMKIGNILKNHGVMVEYSRTIDECIDLGKRGTKIANFAVLKNTKMPLVLVELGFITNESDAKILKNRQDELAVSVAKGILKNMGIKYIEKKQETNVPKENKDKIYRVQLGAFKDRKNAEDLVKELKSKGYEAIIV